MALGLWATCECTGARMNNCTSESSPSNSALWGQWEGPAILLVDLDAFFASVEQLDHPEWRGKPVIVGGDANKRGVVSTASYEARAFGVRSAMPSSQAVRLCPQAIWTGGHFGRYRELSNAVMDILRSETPHVQQVSIDEAFLDVSPTRINREHPVEVARRVQARVQELGITCSVGVATSKSVAKIASEMDKPRGLTVVYPGSERTFLDPLPVRALSGVGPAAQAKLHAHGIDTLGDLAHASEQLMVRLLGKNGHTMRQRALGIDDSPVVDDNSVKSVSSETSFAVDLTQRADIEAAIGTMAAKVGRRLRRKGLAGLSLELKVRYGDRSVHTARCRMANPTDDELAMLPLLYGLLDELWAEGMPLRLVGVAVSGFAHDHAVQESLFDDGEFANASAAQKEAAGRKGAASRLDDARRQELLHATDAVRDRFGEEAVAFGRELRSKRNTTGTAAKNPEDYK